MSYIKICLADDHSIVREGLKGIINNDPALKVVGEAKDGEELISLLESQKCDLAIVDISMPLMDGLSAIKKIKRDYPKTRVLILSMLKDYQHFKQAVAHGAAGYIVKDDLSEQIIKAIKTVLAGKRYISPSVSKVLAERQLRSIDDEEAPSLEILTKREKQILELIAKGLPNKNIAAKLKISIRTVENHRANLTEKLQIKNTAALIKYALSKGMA